jgi:hypothetical protein
VADTKQEIYATTFIGRQHDQIRELFDAVASAAPEERAEAFTPLVRLLAVHETAEEMVIYPMAARGEARWPRSARTCSTTPPRRRTRCSRCSPRWPTPTASRR